MFFEGRLSRFLQANDEIVCNFNEFLVFFGEKVTSTLPLLWKIDYGIYIGKRDVRGGEPTGDIPNTEKVPWKKKQKNLGVENSAYP